MRLLALDPTMGASGDMLLGALLDAGASPETLDPLAEGLGISFRIEPVERSGLGATAVTVLRDGERLTDSPTSDEPEGHPHRPYPEIVETIESLALPDAVRRRSLAVMERLGRAEAAVHGTDLPETTLHEAGADDAIADVVGTCLLLSELAPDRIVTTPVATGTGSVETSHGTYPVPPPAVVELAVDAEWTVRGGPVERELLTPTGAALLAELADGVEAWPQLSVETVGYGAGDARIEGHANVLRAVLGTAEAPLRQERVSTLRTTVDDVTPEVLGGLHETLADAGARDVSIAARTMKKGRPGHEVTVICPPEAAEAVADRLARETGTLGIREPGAGHRWVADRELREVALELDGETHEIPVKIARDDAGAVYDVSAEFDDALEVGLATGRPVREIQRIAEQRARGILDS